MNLKTFHDWNLFLIRFFVAFAFWEVVAFPLRMLFFSKFYHDPNLIGIFVPLGKVYWLVPIGADFIGIFSIGSLFTLIKNSLPPGIVGGLLFALIVSIFGYVSPTIFITSLTNLAVVQLWWIYALFLSIQTTIVSIIYSISFSEKTN